MLRTRFQTQYEMTFDRRVAPPFGWLESVFRALLKRQLETDEDGASREFEVMVTQQTDNVVAVSISVVLISLATEDAADVPSGLRRLSSNGCVSRHCESDEHGLLGIAPTQMGSMCAPRSLES